MFNITQRIIRTLALAALFTIPLLPLQRAMAAFMLGGGEDYAILFQGTGGNTLQVTNVTVNGNVGVGDTGNFTDSGPSTITGRVDFSGTDTTKFHSNNAGNTFNGGQNSPPYMGTFGVAAVTTALNTVNSLSQMLFSHDIGQAGDGTSVAINGNTTVNASSGAVFTINGQLVHVFNASSFTNGGNQTLTINGSASDLVAINLGSLGNIQFHGGIQFTGGITSDDVVFNVGGGDYTAHTGAGSLDINNNGGTAGLAQGIFLDPNGAMDATNAEIFGRMFGGDAHDFQYVSGSTITQPPGVPDPGATVLLMGLGLAFLAGAKKKFHS